MSLFTVIWVIAVAIALFSKGMKRITFITLLFMTFQCANVFEYGNLHIGPQILLFLKSILLSAS